jgi:hypothetical protein
MKSENENTYIFELVKHYESYFGIKGRICILIKDR